MKFCKSTFIMLRFPCSRPYQLEPWSPITNQNILTEFINEYSLFMRAKVFFRNDMKSFQLHASWWTYNGIPHSLVLKPRRVKWLKFSFGLLFIHKNSQQVNSGACFIANQIQAGNTHLLSTTFRSQLFAVSNWTCDLSKTKCLEGYFDARSNTFTNIIKFYKFRSHKVQILLVVPFPRCDVMHESGPPY